MKKVVRLSESDLSKIIKKIIKEDDSNWWTKYGFDSEDSFISDYEEADDYASELINDVDYELQELFYEFFNTIDISDIIKKHQSMFIERYPQYVNTVEEFNNVGIGYLMGANNNPNLEKLYNNINEELMNYIFYK